jgi:hypothetical protein
MEQKYIRIYRLLTFIFSSLLIILILSAWVRENFLSEWRRYQHEFREIAKTEDVEQSEVKDILKI